MASCEMCGKQGEIFYAEIEGTTLSVCVRCAQYGRILRRAPVPKPVAQTVDNKKAEEPKKEEVLLTIIVPDYSKRIKEKREKLGLTHEELAKKLAEKESIVQKIESGKMLPTMTLAEKIEHVLKIKLIDQITEESGNDREKFKSSEFTIGDMIKTKKR